MWNAGDEQAHQVDQEKDLVLNGCHIDERQQASKVAPRSRLNLRALVGVTSKQDWRR